MPNKRYSKFPSKGAKTGQRGNRHDTVGPMKTAKWPGVPGKTQPKKPSFPGFKKMCQGLADEGI